MKLGSPINRDGKPGNEIVTVPVACPAARSQTAVTGCDLFPMWTVPPVEPLTA